MRKFSEITRTLYKQGNAANFNLTQKCPSGCGYILANRDGSGTGYGYKYGHGGLFYPHALIQYWSNK